MVGEGHRRRHPANLLGRGMDRDELTAIATVPDRTQCGGAYSRAVPADAVHRDRAGREQGGQRAGLVPELATVRGVLRGRGDTSVHLQHLHPRVEAALDAESGVAEDSEHPVVLRKDLGLEPLDPAVARHGGKVLEQEGAEPLVPEGVVDEECHLACPRVYRLGGRQGDDPAPYLGRQGERVRRAEHVFHVGMCCPTGDREESHAHGVVRHPLVQLVQHGPVTWLQRADHRQGAIREEYVGVQRPCGLVIEQGQGQVRRHASMLGPIRRPREGPRSLGLGHWARTRRLPETGPSASPPADHGLSCGWPRTSRLKAKDQPGPMEAPRQWREP